MFFIWQNTARKILLSDITYFRYGKEKYVNLSILKDGSGETIKNVVTVEGSNIEELGELEEISVNPSETENTATPNDTESSNRMKLRKIATDTLNYALASLVAIVVGMFSLRGDETKS